MWKLEAIALLGFIALFFSIRNQQEKLEQYFDGWRKTQPYLEEVVYNYRGIVIVSRGITFSYIVVPLGALNAWLLLMVHWIYAEDAIRAFMFPIIF